MTFYCNSVIATQLSGEFVLLAKVLGGFFHQNAYCSEPGGEVLSDMDVFRQVHNLHDERERGQLMSDLSALISKDDAAVVSFWNTHAGCHNYNLEDAAEAREFLAQFRQYLREHPV